MSTFDVVNILVWDNFKAHRVRLKKPMTPNAERLILKKLVRFYEQGHDPNEILETSIEHGWQGVFAPKRSRDVIEERFQQGFRLDLTTRP